MISLSAVLVWLAMAGVGLSEPCPESKPLCLTCNIDNYCETCKPGTFMWKEYKTDDFGTCIHCSKNCMACRSADTCDKCEPPYFVFNGSCQTCAVECLTCDKDPVICSSCRHKDYVLDMKGECYYRHGPTLVVVLLIGGVLSFIVCSAITGWLLRLYRRQRKRTELRNQSHESFLDPHFMKENQNAVLNEVGHIGVAEDNDISAVMETPFEEGEGQKGQMIRRQSALIDHDESISHDILKDH